MTNAEVAQVGTTATLPVTEPWATPDPLAPDYQPEWAARPLSPEEIEMSIRTAIQSQITWAVSRAMTSDEYDAYAVSTRELYLDRAADRLADVGYLVLSPADLGKLSGEMRKDLRVTVSGLGLRVPLALTDRHASVVTEI